MKNQKIENEKIKIIKEYAKLEADLLKHLKEQGIVYNDPGGTIYGLVQEGFWIFKRYRPVVVGNAYNDLIDGHLKALRKERDKLLDQLQKQDGKER